MITTANYRVELYIDGDYVGDIRHLAQSLTWARRRTTEGVDSIDFTINDVLFAEWAEERGYTLLDLLRPLALDCRIVRNNEYLVGGFLATMPAYAPKGASADLQMKFDGFTNLLAGVYINPIGTQTGEAGAMFAGWILMADSRAYSAGKGFDFWAGTVNTFPSITQTFDNYKTVKDAIADRADNTTGAGIFDLYWDADRTYNLIRDANFGKTINTYTIRYPLEGAVGAVSISANEVSGFASSVIGVGAGEISSNANNNTAIIYKANNSAAIARYGYAEVMYQDSSISRSDTLQRNSQARLTEASNIQWQPNIVLTGAEVAPEPTNASNRIWLGDKVQIRNTEDMTGQTSGWFRVQELVVGVSQTNAEQITPTLRRI